MSSIRSMPVGQRKPHDKEPSISNPTVESIRKASSEITGARPKRKTMHTEAGKQYHIEQLKNKRNVTFSHVRRQCQDLFELLHSATSTNRILTDKDALNEMYNIFGLVNEEYISSLENNQQRLEAKNWFDQRSKIYLECISNVNEVLSAMLKERASSISGSIKSIRSHHSSITSVRVRRADATARKASLEAEMQFIDAESKLDADAKRLQLHKQLAKARAEEDVFLKIEEEEFDLQDNVLKPPSENGASDHLDKFFKDQSIQMQENLDEFEAKELQSSQLNPNAFQFVKCGSNVMTAPNPIVKQEALDLKPKMKQAQELDRSNEVGGNESILKLMGTLVDIQQRSSLPNEEPEVFDGDILKYPTWWRNFEDLIEKNVSIPGQRLRYLSKYTIGDARRSIEGFVGLNSEEAYEEAKQTLKDWFGNPATITRAYKKQLKEWPNVCYNDGGISMRDYAHVLKNCKHLFQSTKYLSNLDADDDLNQALALKLPKGARDRWARKVCEYESRHNAFPPFTEFCEYVDKEAKIATHTVCGSAVLDMYIHKEKPDYAKRQPRMKNARSFVIKSNNQNYVKEHIDIQNPSKCLCCGSSHSLDKCELFGGKSYDQKIELLRTTGACFGCLAKGHRSRGCLYRKTCDVCHKHHPTVLHSNSPFKMNKAVDSNAHADDIPPASAVCNTSKVPQGCKTTRVVPVWMYHVDDPNKEIQIYALLDEQSDTTFVLDNVMDNLGIRGDSVKLSLSTMTTSATIDCRKIKGLEVRGDNGQRISLPPCYTREVIPTNHNQIPTRNLVRQQEYMEKISKNIPEYMPDLEVGLLIGTDCMQALKPLEIISDPNKDSYAIRTRLGWTVVGLHGDSGDHTEMVNSISHRILTQEVNTERLLSHSFVTINQTKEILNPFQVLNCLEKDFVEADSKPTHKYCTLYGINKSLSIEDKKFLKICELGIQKTKNDHYEIPLPFREDKVTLPNNRSQALQRLKGLERRFAADGKYKQDYINFMKDLFVHGYAERVPEDADVEHDHVWYIPHHGVYHPHKPEKIRVVFDRSAEYQNESLNRHLLQGPDLTNALIGVLLRFRKEPVAIIADIESMFHQVRVNPQHRNFLRFLWFENGDPSNAPVDYRMCVHLFGAASSPGCANFALKFAANEYEKDCGSDAANFLRKDFYVDDGLKSVKTVACAVDLMKKSKKICDLGGFNLTKFNSNSKEVVRCIAEKDRTKSIKNLNLDFDPLPIERVLGVEWSIQDDSFTFLIKLKDRPFTRRGILSTVCSIYDPYGFLSPVMLEGKRILQELCRDGADWDEPIPELLKTRWRKWRHELPSLERIKIRRCYKPEGFGTVVSTQLHHFSDAAKSGYGQCSYLRIIDDQDRIHCSFVFAKARVPPLRRVVSIPRLELTASVLSIKTAELIHSEIELENVEEYFWTDSRVVLGYIANEARRFHVFVGNRVQLIRDYCQPSQWRYVESKNNPADDTSRGLLPCHLLSVNHRYLNGPGFLWNPMEFNKECDVTKKVLDENDPEIRKSITCTTQGTQEFTSLLNRLSQISSWQKAKKFIAILLLFRSYLLNHNSDGHRSFPRNLTVVDLQAAERQILKMVQGEAFGKEVQILTSMKVTDVPYSHREQIRVKNMTLKRTSTLYRLDPYLDSDGILRVGGRIKASSFPENIKHPIILPRNSHITQLIIRFLHERIEHQGRGITLNEIRSSGYYIIGGISAVSHYISKCTKCRKLRGLVQEQKMADLPIDRIEPHPPFTYCGVDVFGHFLIKEGRKELKRYGVIFTCLASRAIRIEVAPSLETDAFLNALRRFICRNGPIRQLRCDQGTNFVGASNSLNKALAEMDHVKIHSELLEQNCDYIQFKFNVPSASHMGGVWERQIRSIRSVLSAILDKNGVQLDDDSLRTFIIEAEAIVNSRPLTVEHLGRSDSLIPLSPNHLLTSKTKVVLPPPGIFEPADLYSRKRWRRVQHLSNEFWQRWRKEYLQSLQVRHKWNRPRRDMKIGDIVIIVDEKLPRNSWPLAKIVETYPDDRDGHIRKVKCQIGSNRLDTTGKRTQESTFIDRPIQKLVLICESE